MNQESCFSIDQLRLFALGRLATYEYTQIETHLQNCLVCEETVASLDDPTDSLLRDLQISPAAASYAHDEAYQRALSALQILPLIAPSSSDAASPSSSPGPRVDESEPSGVRRLRDYQLFEPLGYGGMGTVYRATHLRLHRDVAFKLLPERRLRDSLAVSRFQREMRAVGQMDHPAIIRAMDAGEVTGHHYLAMELVDGVDLTRLIRHSGPLAIGAACEIIRQTALGLQYVHERGIVHRDIKPSNIMLNRHGQVKILDLGLALLDGVHGTTDELTTVGQLMGTLDYMAPEQFQDSHDVDERADVYGLAATLYKLLTGHAPYSGAVPRTPLQKLRALATEPAPSILSHRPNLPQALTEAIHAGLGHDPALRTASAQAFAEAITRWANASELTPLIAEFTAIRLEASREVAIRHSAAAVDPSLELGLSVRKATSIPEAREATQRGTHRNWLRAIAIILVGLLTAGLAGVIVYIETDQGELVIQSPTDNVEVSLKRNGKSLPTTLLKQGANTLVLRSGNYELALSGAIRGLRIDTDRVTIRRGLQEQAGISHESPNELSPKSATNVAGAELNHTPWIRVPSPNEPGKYEDKTLKEWLDVLANDHSLPLRAKSIEAICTLANGADDVTEIISLVTADLNQDDHFHVFKTSNGSAQQLIGVVAGELCQLEPASLFAGLAEALNHGKSAQRLTALHIIPRLGKDPAPITDQLIEVSYDEQPIVRRLSAESMLICSALPEAGRQRLVAMLSDNDVDVRLEAALALSVHYPNEPGIADQFNQALIVEAMTPSERSLGALTPRDRLELALHGITYLGEKGASCVPNLERLLQAHSSTQLLMHDSFVPMLPGTFKMPFSQRQRPRVFGDTFADRIVTALRSIGPAAKAAGPTLESFLSRIESNRSPSAQGLIQIPSKPNEQLIVDTLTEITNGAWQPRSSAPSSTTDLAVRARMRTYDGKTFSEWLELVTNEKQPYQNVTQALRELSNVEDPSVVNAAFDRIMSTARQELSYSQLIGHVTLLCATATSDRAEQAAMFAFETYSRLCQKAGPNSRLFQDGLQEFANGLSLLPTAQREQAIRERMTDGDVCQRMLAMTALDSSRDLGFVSEIIAVSRDENGRVMTMAIDRLLKLAVKEPLAKRRLDEILVSDVDDTVRIQTAQKIFAIERPCKDIESAKKMANDPNPRTALMGLCAIAALSAENVGSPEGAIELRGFDLAEFADLLRDRDWGVGPADQPYNSPRRLLIALLGEYSTDAALKILEEELSQPRDESLRPRVLSAIENVKGRLPTNREGGFF